MPVRSTQAPEVLANATPSSSILSEIQILDTGGRTYTFSEFNHAFLKVRKKLRDAPGSALTPRQKIGIVKSDHHAMQETAKELESRPGLTQENPAGGQQASVTKAADAVAKGLKRSLEQIKELKELTDKLALVIRFMDLQYS
jgi:hypothetical protein